MPTLQVLPYLPDVVALFAFGLRRVLPDRRLADALVNETKSHLKCLNSPAGSIEGATLHVRDRLDFEGVRRDVQSCSAASLAGVLARAGDQRFTQWALLLTGAWIVLLVFANTVNVPTNGVRERRSRQTWLIVVMLVFIGFSVLGKYLSLLK